MPCVLLFILARFQAAKGLFGEPQSLHWLLKVLGVNDTFFSSSQAFFIPCVGVKMTPFLVAFWFSSIVGQIEEQRMFQLLSPWHFKLALESLPVCLKDKFMLALCFLSAPDLLLVLTNEVIFFYQCKVMK